MPDLTTMADTFTTGESHSEPQNGTSEDQSEGEDSDSDETEDEAPKPSTRPKAIRRSREFVFSKTLKISKQNSRFADMYDELTSVKVTENPNAVSLLLRAFVEMLIKEYIKKHHIKGINKSTPLREAVEQAVTHFKDQNGMTNADDCRGILEACEEKNLSSMFSIESFQQLVHREQLKPIPSEVIGRWDNIEPALAHLLANT